MLNSPILYQTYLKVFTPEECKEIERIAKEKVWWFGHLDQNIDKNRLTVLLIEYTIIKN